MRELVQQVQMDQKALHKFHYERSKCSKFEMYQKENLRKK
jgi:hypothetical protein